MTRFQDLLRTANNLRLLTEIGRSGGALASIADLVDSYLGSPMMEACLERFRATPGGALLLEERYPPLKPDIDALALLPPGTLGHRYAQLIRSLHYDPEFFRPRDVSTEERWLTQRIASTHDVHHVVCGFGTEQAGEIGVLTLTALQIGFPAYVLLSTVGQLATFRLQPDRFPRLSQAVAQGAALARSTPCLAAVRWEEGWDKPLSQWRQELGILDPADGEPWGLDAQLGALPCPLA
ncbi:MAG: Coq4 family protein [Cyanobacteriota bacterium]|nr:Coq4 family protein [Cyanobacteriota bacterium]